MGSEAVLTIKPSLWTTVECEAWSRGFDYDNYLELHQKRQEGCKVLTEDAYRVFCEAYEFEMIQSMRAEGFSG